PVELLVQALRGSPVKPSARVEGIPPELEDLVLQMIARRPDARPKCAPAIHDALDAALRRLTSSTPGFAPQREVDAAPGGADLAATVVDVPPESARSSPPSWL